MKELIKISISIVLILGLIFSLSGCGETEADAIVGKWETQVAHDDLDTGYISEKTELDDYIDMSDVYKTITIEFFDDGTYVLETDIDTYIDDFVDAIEDAVDAYCEDVIKENDLDISVSELMEESDATYDDFIDQDALDELREESDDYWGDYKIEDGNLYLDADEWDHIEYSISGNRLTFKEGFGADWIDLIGVFPIKFSRVY